MKYIERCKALEAAEMALTQEYLKNDCAVTDVSIQREYEHKIEDFSVGRNVVLFDEKGQPAIMCRRPGGKKRTHDWLSNKKVLYQQADSLPLHQSFYIDDVPYDVLDGKYPMGRVNGVNKAVSLRGLHPAMNIDSKAGQNLAKTRGGFWSNETWSSYDYLNKLADRESFDCYGNTYYGRDDRRSDEWGTEVHIYPDGKKNKTGLIATGSGPHRWYLDGTPFSPWGIVGNQWEEAPGNGTFNGRPVLIPQNNAALLTYEAGGGLEAGSKKYKAISAIDGSFIEIDAENAIMVDFINEAGVSKPYCFSDQVLHPYTDDSFYGSSNFSTLTVRDIERFAILEQYGLLRGSDGKGTMAPTLGGYVSRRFKQGVFYVIYVGGSCTDSYSARRRAADGIDSISYSSDDIGCRLMVVSKW